uniref:Helicase ATP-binding domain-containing protein n=1 Tax=Panagrolaimus sp. PS1159 TaxID=55785 RepID=A0AC35F4F4_9BILA
MNYSSVIKVPDEQTLDALCAKTFNHLLMHLNVIQRICNIGYKLPTAIQSGALPLALSGRDLIVQSPPESGKTLVYAALAAHIVNDNHQSKQREPFVTILAASREHVTKIKDLIVKLVPDGNNVCAFYGDGDDFTDDKITKGCSVVIGTPDRMAKLCADGGITIKLSQLFIIDDADKLMAPTFVENIQSVFNHRGSVVQVAAFCSSYPDGIERFLLQFMESPSIFRIDCQDVHLSVANRDDKVAVEDNTTEIDGVLTTSLSDQLSKSVSSIESSASPTETLPASSRNADVDEPPVASQSTNANVDEPSMAAQSAAVQLNAANCDDKVAIKDKTPEIGYDVKENTPEKATSQADQLSKNVSLDEPSAYPTKTPSGGIFGQSNGFGAQNIDSGFGSTRGGSSGGFGAQNNDGDQGFGSTRGGSRGGYNRSTEFGGDNQIISSRGCLGRGGSIFVQINNSDNQMNSSRGGFGRGGFGQSNDNQQYSNAFGENQMSLSGATRGGFGGGRGGFGGGRGGFGASNSAQDQMNSSGSSRGGSGFGHPAADNSQDAPAPENKPQSLILRHRFVR